CTQTTFQSESHACPASMPLQYIEHALNGTRLGQTKSATFAFDWTPPAADVGSVVVYVAGNAANGDGSQGGDHIYTQKYTLSAAAQQPTPTIASAGVVNAASFQAAVSPGAWVTIQGTNLANSSRSWTGGDFTGNALPTALDGVSVTIDGKAAYVGYISPTQINVLAPAASAQGPVAVQVANNGLTGAAATAQLQTAAPAFFLWSGKYAVATRSDFSLVAPANLFQGVTTTPAKPGDVIILWGTGFGATTPVVDPGVLPPSDQLAGVANTVTVTVAGVPATVVGAALAPGNAGLYQIAVQIPDSVSDGDQPVVTQVSGIASPSNVFLSVQR
ncbi:MAG TPA: choice-of-anchor V domain-containing protein, partial [Candidatus Solibacter sp.]|nr:choice-of-anchor V domain-containing protein [Candidatus Solibacter sp.]